MVWFLVKHRDNLTLPYLTFISVTTQLHDPIISDDIVAVAWIVTANVRKLLSTKMK
jgi:hypothetical protein